MHKLFLPVEVRRNKVLRARVTPAEKDLIERRALDCAQSTSDFLRACALGKKTRSQSVAHVINELRQLNHTLKSHRQDGIPVDLELYEDTLSSISEAIEAAGLRMNDMSFEG